MKPACNRMQLFALPSATLSSPETRQDTCLRRQRYLAFQPASKPAEPLGNCFGLDFNFYKPSLRLLAVVVELATRHVSREASGVRPFKNLTVACLSKRAFSYIQPLQKLLTETAAVPLSCRSFDDLESQPRGFPLKRVDLTVAVLSLVEVRASVDKLHSVAQHAMHESG